MNLYLPSVVDSSKSLRLVLRSFFFELPALAISERAVNSALRTVVDADQKTTGCWRYY